MGQVSPDVGGFGANLPNRVSPRSPGPGRVRGQAYRGGGAPGFRSKARGRHLGRTVRADTLPAWSADVLDLHQVDPVEQVDLDVLDLGRDAVVVLAEAQ